MGAWDYTEGGRPPWCSSRPGTLVITEFRRIRQILYATTKLFPRESENHRDQEWFYQRTNRVTRLTRSPFTTGLKASCSYMPIWYQRNREMNLHDMWMGTVGPYSRSEEDRRAYHDVMNAVDLNATRRLHISRYSGEDLQRMKPGGDVVARCPYTGRDESLQRLHDETTNDCLAPMMYFRGNYTNCTIYNKTPVRDY